VFFQGEEYPLESTTNLFPLEKSGDLIFKLEFNIAGLDGIVDSYSMLIE
jgi:hypothetical protein